VSHQRPCIVVLLLLCAPAAAAIETAEEPGSPDAAKHASATDVNREVTDPVSTTWSLKLQNNINFIDIAGHGDQVQDTVKFQPTMPILLTSALTLITRPEFTLLDSKPFTTSQGALRRTTGVGDTILDLVLSPKLGPWLAALGPTFVFPTANLNETGQGKWQAGPAGVAGYKTEKFLAVLIAQQWWSFAGAQDRAAVSELHLQYIASYFFGDGWSIGTAPTIAFDWRAEPGNQVTFPFGPSVTKVVKFTDALPVKFEVRGMYVPVHPDPNGKQFIIELVVTPVIPSLIRGPVWSEP
jgi:hypothetical protein